MAEIVAEAFLSIVFEKLFEQLASPEFRKNAVASKLKELEGNLKKARLLLDDAEDRQMKEPSVKEWLAELKHLIFMADDLVEEIINSKKEPRSVRKVVRRAFKSVYHSLANTVQGEIDLILADLDVLLDRALVLELKHTTSNSQSSRSSPRFISPLREEHHVFGREADKEKILKILLSNDTRCDKIAVLPIVAMGGLGKTTLAQLLYDDTRVDRSGFELKAWVTVSTEFDFVRIIKAVLRQINAEVLKDDVEEPTHLQRLMKETLRGKRFLFVLDDVWDENYDNWDLLMSNFTTGDSRSRIIVTTRSRDVGAIVKTGPMYELEPVSYNDCWSIFVHHAFNGETESHSRLQEIGKRIVDKCKGVPLAVKSIGGLLRSERNPEKWESILTSHVWEWSKNQESNNGVLPSLWLSYRYLPSSLKQCFAYCSVFPQDFEFGKNEMVLLWMAEGFFPSKDQEKRMEQIGDQYFNALISRSLIQRSSRDESKFVMHDLVHDLAVFVSGEFCFSIREDGRNSEHLTTRTRHLSHIVSDGHDFLKSVSIPKHLRTFLTDLGPRHRMGYLSDVFVKRLAKEGRSLRVLSLSTESRVLPNSLGDLKHLRYLEFSGSKIEELPDSICSLFNLETLLLSRCRELKRFPTKMRKLINLRHLDTSYSGLEEMPMNMSNLKKLQILTDFFVGKPGSACFTLKELGELQHLGGRLCIHGLQNVENVEDARQANLRDKAELKELTLEWELRGTANAREDHLLDALQPHTNLEKLTIDLYSGSSFPKWIGEPSFSKMVSVKLFGGRSHLRLCLPPLGQLPSLKLLGIKSFNGVENIGSEFYGNSNSSTTPFPCLETLWFYRMERWSEWSFVGRDGKEIRCFPRLKRLELDRCEDLDGSFKLDKFPRLESLVLNKCPKLKSITSRTEDHRLTSLAIRDCLEMESFPGVGLPLSLKSLEIADCKKLVAQNRHWDLQRLTSLTSLSIDNSDIANSDSFPQGLLPTSLTSFTLIWFQRLKTLNGIAFQQLKSLERLAIYYCNELETLPEQVLQTTSLCYLEIYECAFLERRYHKKKGNDSHRISHIPQIRINGYTT